jgi:hypothetical protein
MYEEGKYKARITGQTIGENKKGNPEIQLYIQPIGYYTPQGLEAGSYQWERTVFLTLTDKTIGTEKDPGWIMKLLWFLGFEGKSFAQLDQDHEQPHSFVGQEVDALCQHDNYQGKAIEKWSILTGGAQRPAVKALANKGLRALDAKFGKVLKGHAPDAARVQEAKQPPTGCQPEATEAD